MSTSQVKAYLAQCKAERVARFTDARQKKHEVNIAKLTMRAERAQEIIRLYRDEGWVLRQIAEKYDLSWERVRQIIKSVLGEIPEEVKRAHRRGPSAERIKLTCPQCRKHFEMTVTSWKAVKGVHTCSRVCRNLLQYGNPDGQTKEQHDAKARIHAKIYYHTHKNDPEFKEKKRKINMLLALKRLEL